MSDDPTKRPGGAVTPLRTLDPRTVAALRAVLALDPDTAAQVRFASSSRRRPVARHGPRLDLGGPPEESDRDRTCGGDGSAPPDG